MKSNIPILLALALLLSGCDTLKIKEREQAFVDENNAYVSKTFDELVKGKGVPTGTATLSDGSKVVEYYHAQIEISGGGSYTFPAATYVENSAGGRTWIYIDQMRSLPMRSWNKICKIDFLVSSKNVVESWKYDGKGCY